MGDLLRRYLPALRAHLVEVRRLTPDAAGDVLQGFVADKVLGGDGLVERADRTRGRFRSLLLRSLENYLATQRARQARTPVPFPPEELPEVGVPAAQQEAFDRGWALQVVRGAVEGMRLECLEKDRRDLWEVFQARVIGPALEGAEAPSYEELVSRFGIGSPRQAINLLVTAKRMFNRHLEHEVAGYQASPAGVAEELCDLRTVLLRTAAAEG